MEALRDIKDIVVVHDQSLESLIALIVLALLVIFLLVYFLKTRRRRRKRPTAKAMALQHLQNMDYSNTKEVVYTLSTDGFLWLNEKNQQEFKALEEALISYKYKKEVPLLDKKMENRIKAFVKELK